MYRGVAQLASALRSGRRGREFKSPHPDFARQNPTVRRTTAGYVFHNPETKFSGAFEDYVLLFLSYMEYYVYILRSLKDGKYYIGSTSDINKRLKYHNAGKQRSTSYRIPFILVYSEKLFSKTEALKREKQIKAFKGGEAFKKLIGV
jgi:putative endonuclease